MLYLVNSKKGKNERRRGEGEDSAFCLKKEMPKFNASPLVLLSHRR